MPVTFSIYPVKGETDTFSKSNSKEAFANYTLGVTEGKDKALDQLVSLDFVHDSIPATEQMGDRLMPPSIIYLINILISK